ncbi:MAG TPA: succinate dehydrogenase assembly factor 2 [Candidatus Macondimonas sp.]|nr:succinate dehydrogenase assembly factor 2 [Candidatus Macondimonas sp.]
MAGAVGASELGRLRWRCRRGMKELDELLLAYLPHYSNAPAAERAAFETLLELPDPDLYQLMLATTAASDPSLEPLLERLRRGLPHRS